MIPYTASKAAVRMITMQMCNEWAEYGIRVNGIAPGYIVTDLTEAMRSEPDRVEQVNMRIPMKRWGDRKILQQQPFFSLQMQPNT